MTSFIRGTVGITIGTMGGGGTIGYGLSPCHTAELGGGLLKVATVTKEFGMV